MKAFKDNSLADYVLIYSDKYLAYEISQKLASSSDKLNGDIGLTDGIDQAIILKKGLDSAVWGDWEDKFFASPATYNAEHNYLIVTACVSLTGYVSGAADLLPSNLYLSVLVDLNDASCSKGLLYNMNHTDMGIFEFVMHKYNAQFVSVDNMAVQLATIINDG